jgi:hypothetical protein
LGHDSEREYPVYFHRQLLDWPLPLDVVQRMHLDVQPVSESILPQPEPMATAHEQPPRLVIEVDQLSNPHQRHGTTTRTFRASKAADYAGIDAKNRTLGSAGECLVLDYERDMLIRKGRTDLAQRVRHVADIEGDGAGYDVMSFNEDGTIKYIEVKTTRGPAETTFFLSAHELVFAHQHREHYRVYRVYHYSSQTHTGKCYIIAGTPEPWFEMTPTQYRLRPR